MLGGWVGVENPDVWTLGLCEVAASFVFISFE
jgi:hypothetical protein